jgi:hypothetical protein
MYITLPLCVSGNQSIEKQCQSLLARRNALNVPLDNALMVKNTYSFCFIYITGCLVYIIWDKVCQHLNPLKF